MAVQQPIFQGQNINPAKDFMQGMEWAERNRQRRIEQQRATELFEFKNRQQRMAAKAMEFELKKAENQFAQADMVLDQKNRAAAEVQPLIRRIEQVSTNPDLTPEQRERELFRMNSVIAQMKAANPAAADSFDPVTESLNAATLYTAEGVEAQNAALIKEAEQDGLTIVREDPEKPYDYPAFMQRQTVRLGGQPHTILTNKINGEGRARISATYALVRDMMAEDPQKAVEYLSSNEEVQKLRGFEEGAEMVKDLSSEIMKSRNQIRSQQSRVQSPLVTEQEVDELTTRWALKGYMVNPRPRTTPEGKVLFEYDIVPYNKALDAERAKNQARRQNPPQSNLPVSGLEEQLGSSRPQQPSVFTDPTTANAFLGQ